ncbi:MAG: adenosylcobinamide amidohydrolase [Bacillaceae bacterium]|nr:adenosylcobinamide amidohydrolase [Bacillaceae bacterium]
MQPFLTSETYRSSIWPDMTISLRQDHILITSETMLETAGSSLLGGGMGRAGHFVNWKVPRNYQTNDPVQEMQAFVQSRGYPMEATVGMQTAADIRQASITEEKGDGFGLICCVTAGVSNAARAGKRYETYCYDPGTINMVILFDGALSPAGMINGITTATEAKTAALQDLGVRDQEGDWATGTTTDSIVIAVNPKQRRDRLVGHFAGVATAPGNAIGRCIYQAVYEALKSEEG